MSPSPTPHAIGKGAADGSPTLPELTQGSPNPVTRLHTGGHPQRRAQSPWPQQQGTAILASRVTFKSGLKRGLLCPNPPLPKTPEGPAHCARHFPHRCGQGQRHGLQKGKPSCSPASLTRSVPT